MGTMTFRGWPVEAVEFYEGLHADNSRVYWQDHKEIYERCVRAPMEQLLAEQRRTNRLLQTLIYAGLGFVVSLVVLQVGMHLQLIY